jgi:transcriptional regulator with GAF, ATPase, and Fis domain
MSDQKARESVHILPLMEEEIRGSINFEQIIGNSPALKHVLELVETVAPNDSTVLLLGETGTGKELVARAIHGHSRRRDRRFVKLNCAAIPTGLLESELFGHEKGAFTGAIMQKMGRLELADQGTLFLDEVGDIPIEIQPKLLRALQEREFEQLGQHPYTKSKCTPGCGNPPRPGEDDCSPRISQRFVLSLERVSDPHSTVTGAQGRHSFAGALLRTKTIETNAKEH